MQAKGNNIMIDSRRDYSEEMANLCRQYNVKYLGLHGSTQDQENIPPEEREINFLVEFFPLDAEQHDTCYLTLEKELLNLFGCHINLLDLTGITYPGLLRPLTRRKIDIYKG
jgi:predicted nucleotidyltransferase